MNTLTAEPNYNHFDLFKGPSGCGKSVAALSYPNPYVFDFDRKMPGVARKHFPKKSIEYDTFDHPNDAAIKQEQFLASCPFETLIYDSFTSMATTLVSALSSMIGESVPKQMSRMIKEGLKKSGSGNEILDAINISIYNHEVRFFDYMMETAKMMWARPGNPKHIVFIAHVISVESAPDLKTKVITKTRSVVTAGKKAAAIIPSKFDNVFMFAHREEGGMMIGGPDSSVKFLALTKHSGDDDAKTTYPIPDEIDFTNKSFFDEMNRQIAGREMFNK